jgi:HK97 family phage portal protein
MGIFKRLGAAMGFKADPAPFDSAALASAIGSGYETVTGQTVSTTRAMQMTTVFACVRVLAESVGMLPCRLVKETGRTRNTATGHRLSKLLSLAPNGYMTSQEFWELLITCLCLRGNFYAYKVFALGNVVELLPIDPGMVTPKLGADWSVTYEVKFKNGETKTLTQDEIWHVRLFTVDGLNGLNPIAYARQAIALGLSTEEHGSRLFTNGAVTSGVLATDQSLTDEAFTRLKDQFHGEHMGVANAHKPMILEMGLNWKPIRLNAEASQFLETRKMQRHEICAVYRVPPHLVASLESATLNNMENMGIAFINYALVPLLTRIEHRIRVGLLNEKDQADHYAKFNTGALLRGDLKGRYESYGKGIQWGILSPNDCRDLEDLNPREGGDVYLTPMNMTTNPESQNADKTAP